MKKLFIILMALVCLTSLGGCKKDKDPDPKKDYWDADGNGIADWTEEKITLTYASWQHTDLDSVTIESEMIDAFMTKYPNITVEMLSVGDGFTDTAWYEGLLQLLESHTPDSPTFPDVFLVNRLEKDLSNGCLADITEMYNNDPDSAYIFDSVKNSGVYNGHRYAVPTYIYPQFWVVNKTLLSSKNIPIPTYDWTWTDMQNIAKMAIKGGNDIIGIYGRQGVYGEGGTSAYSYELTKVLKLKNNKEVGKTWVAYSYDGQKFNFMDDAFLEAMNMMETGLSEGWISNGLDATAKLEKYGDETYIPTTMGKVAVWREASWSFKDQIANIEFDWDVYPGPSGVSGGNTDVIGVSSLCTHKQAAYQLMKWMSYSEEGILKRFEIFEDSGSELLQQANNYPYPIVDYGLDENGVNKIWSSIPYGTTAPGLVSPQFLEGLRNGAIQINKETIGWDSADYAIRDYIDQINSGQTTFAAVRETMQDVSDAELSRIRSEIDALIGGN